MRETERPPRPAVRAAGDRSVRTDPVAGTAPCPAATDAALDAALAETFPASDPIASFVFN